MVPKIVGCCLNLQLQRHKNQSSTQMFKKKKLNEKIWKKMEKMKTKIITFENCKAKLTSLARPYGFQKI
jgi:hypothetical protein